MSVMNGREELTSKILGVNGHLKIQPLNGLEIKNVVALESRIEKINTIKTHKVLIGQGPKLFNLFHWCYNERS